MSTLVAALSLSAPNAHAQGAVPLRAPVIITACTGGIASIELVEVAAYDVTLRNEGAVAADEIAMTVRGRRNKVMSFQLKGTFAPGIEIKRRIGRPLGIGLYTYSSSNNDCFIDSVHFANGSTWNR